MKRKLTFRPDALDDLNEVEYYTKRTWGSSQATRYVAILVKDIKAISISGLRHPVQNDVHPGLVTVLRRSLES